MADRYIGFVTTGGKKLAIKIVSIEAMLEEDGTVTIYLSNDQPFFINEPFDSAIKRLEEALNV